MTTRYAYSLRERAALAIFAAEEDERLEVLDIFGALAQSPGQCGPEQVVDGAGRPNEVVYTTRFRVVYWADHAAKEVRLMNIRRF